MYGTLEGANTYFTTRLHSDFWYTQSTPDRTNSLYKATSIIEALNYKGRKATVYTVLEADSAATKAEVRVAEAAQTLEFPRDADITVPTTINSSCYEIAYSLLDGVDPDLELENLAVQNQSYAGVKMTFDRSLQPTEHISNGVPSATAWRMLRPFLRDSYSIRLSRNS